MSATVLKVWFHTDREQGKYVVVVHHVQQSLQINFIEIVFLTIDGIRTNIRYATFTACPTGICTKRYLPYETIKLGFFFENPWEKLYTIFL